MRGTKKYDRSTRGTGQREKGEGGQGAGEEGGAADNRRSYVRMYEFVSMSLLAPLRAKRIQPEYPRPFLLPLSFSPLFSIESKLTDTISTQNCRNCFCKQSANCRGSSSSLSRLMMDLIVKRYKMIYKARFREISSFDRVIYVFFCIVLLGFMLLPVIHIKNLVE